MFAQIFFVRKDFVTMKYFDDIVYGTQYYRAPTPLQSEWEQDILKMDEFGIDTFQIRVQWRQNERGEDNYYFDDVDKLFNLQTNIIKKLFSSFCLKMHRNTFLINITVLVLMLMGLLLCLQAMVRFILVDGYHVLIIQR